MDKEIGNTSMCIYQIVHWQSGNSYVGQTVGKLCARWRNHCRTNSHCKKLSAAIQKYGRDAFELTLLEVCSGKEHLNKREIYWIKELNTLSPNGYNLDSGGNSFERSSETKSKISKSMSGRKFTPEHRFNMSAVRKGKSHSEETKSKMKGRVVPQSQKDYLSKINAGRTVSLETRAKISKTALSKRDINLTEKQIADMERDRLGMATLKAKRNQARIDGVELPKRQLLMDEKSISYRARRLQYYHDKKLGIVRERVYKTTIEQRANSAKQRERIKLKKVCLNKF